MTKRCSRCGETKPVDDFQRRARSKDGRQRWCKPCFKSANDAWRQANLTRVKTTNTAWQDANAERFAQMKEDWKSRNKQHMRAYYARWKRENRNKARIWEHARRARKRAAVTVPFTANQLVERWAYYGDRCWLCRAPATQTDHVKPLSKGGAHMLCNLRPICGPCNAAKHNQWPIQATKTAA